MPFSPDELKASYDFCRRMSRRAGSNFHAGFLLLPREKRRAMEALYAFMRHTDDLADGLISPRPLGEGPGMRAEENNANCKLQIVNCKLSESSLSLSTWRAALEQALQAENLPPSAFRLPPYSPLLPALADTVGRFHIPHEHLFAVIDGVEMDLAPTNYETFDQLERYCEHVASAVGLACIYIWGFRGPEALEPARQMGVALQLTNILRDLREDAAAGRVYLPTADLRQFGYSTADLRAGVANESFVRLMQFEIDRAERFYRGGSALTDFLEPDGRRIFGLMTATYHRLLRRIERRPAEVLRHRVRLGIFTKFKLFSRWMFFSQ